MRNDREVISPSTQGRFWDDCYPKLREGRRVDSVSDQQSVDDTWLQRSPKILAKSGPPRLCSVGIISWTGQTEVPARVLNTTGTRLVDLSATEGTSARLPLELVRKYLVRRWSFDTVDGASKKRHSRIQSLLPWGCSQGPEELVVYFPNGVPGRASWKPRNSPSLSAILHCFFQQCIQRFLLGR